MQVIHTSRDGSHEVYSTFGEARLLPFRDDYSLEFNGTDEYVNCGDVCDFDETDTITVCFWVKGSNKTAERAVISRWEGGTTLQGWYVHIQQTSGYPVFMLSGGSGNDLEVEFETDVLDGFWHFVVITKSAGSGSGTLACLIDDSSATPNVLTDSFSGDPKVLHDCYVGATDATSTPEIFMLGLLDDISIWQAVLSSTALTNLYAGGYPRHVGRYTTPSQDDLLHYWRMGDVIATGYLTDESLGDFGPGLLVNMDSSNRNVDVPNGPPPDLTTDLYNYFHLDEGPWVLSDPVTDSSGLGNDGAAGSAVPSGSPIVAFGTGCADLSYGTARSLIVSSTEASQQEDGWSVQLWVKFTTFSPSHYSYFFSRIQSLNPPHVVLQHAGPLSDMLRVGVYNGITVVYTNVQTILTATNYHIVLRSTGSGVEVYVNNVLQATAPAPSSLVAAAGISLLNEQYLGVNIDEFAWWDKLLNTTEIAALYNGGSGYQIL